MMDVYRTFYKYGIYVVVKINLLLLILLLPKGRAALETLNFAHSNVSEFCVRGASVKASMGVDP